MCFSRLLLARRTRFLGGAAGTVRVLLSSAESIRTRRVDLDASRRCVFSPAGPLQGWLTTIDHNHNRPTTPESRADCQQSRPRLVTTQRIACLAGPYDRLSTRQNPWFPENANPGPRVNEMAPAKEYQQNLESRRGWNWRCGCRDSRPFLLGLALSSAPVPGGLWYQTRPPIAQSTRTTSQAHTHNGKC